MKRRDEFDSSRGELIKLNCLICRDSSFNEIGQVDRYGFYYPTGICRHCGNVQQIEYYDNDTLSDFYTNYYRDIYLNQAPQDLFEEQYARGSSILSFVTPYIPKSAHILEIGTGAGGILKAFKDAGTYDVHGVDFDERYIEYGNSKGIEITQGGIEKMGDGKKFDLVILSHVLEHIINPSDFLKDTRKLLKDGGKIYIEVPSLNHVSRGGYDFDLLLYYQNAHVIHFSVDSLCALIRQCGLNVLKMNDFICCICEKDDARATMEEEGRFSGLFSKQEDLLASIERKRSSPFKKINKKIKKITRKTKKFIKKFNLNNEKLPGR